MRNRKLSILALKIVGKKRAPLRNICTLEIGTIRIFRNIFCITYFYRQKTSFAVDIFSFYRTEHTRMWVFIVLSEVLDRGKTSSLQNNANFIRDYEHAFAKINLIEYLFLYVLEPNYTKSMNIY